MQHDWGSETGNANADAMLRDRKEGERLISWVAFAAVFAALLAGLWYVLTETKLALISTILLAAWAAAASLRNELYRTQSMLLIAERRTQLLEQRLEGLDLQRAP